MFHASEHTCFGLTPLNWCEFVWWYATADFDWHRVKLSGWGSLKLAVTNSLWSARRRSSINNVQYNQEKLVVPLLLPSTERHAWQLLPVTMPLIKMQIGYKLHVEDNNKLFGKNWQASSNSHITCILLCRNQVHQPAQKVHQGKTEKVRIQGYNEVFNYGLAILAFNISLCVGTIKASVTLSNITKVFIQGRTC